MGDRKEITLYTKAVTRKLWDDLLESRKRLTTWCRSNRINRNEIVLSVKKYFPLEWEAKEHLLGPIPIGLCEYCGLEFVINVAGQRYCCTSHARRHWEAKNPDKATSERYAKLRDAKEDSTR